MSFCELLFLTWHGETIINKKNPYQPNPYQNIMWTTSYGIIHDPHYFYGHPDTHQVTTADQCFQVSMKESETGKERERARMRRTRTSVHWVSWEQMGLREENNSASGCHSGGNLKNRDKREEGEERVEKRVGGLFWREAWMPTGSCRPETEGRR